MNLLLNTTKCMKMIEMNVVRELIAVAKMLAEVGDIEVVEPVGSTPVKEKTKRPMDDESED